MYSTKEIFNRILLEVSLFLSMRCPVLSPKSYAEVRDLYSGLFMKMNNTISNSKHDLEYLQIRRGFHCIPDCIKVITDINGNYDIAKQLRDIEDFIFEKRIEAPEIVFQVETLQIY